MLEVRQLVCRYGDRVAVDGVSFRLEAGDIFGLIGANGAGKSSTILALCGLIPVHAGRVILNGEDITDLDAHKRVQRGVALVPEGRRVFAELSVEENLTVGGSRLSRSRMEANRAGIYAIFPRLHERRRQLAGSLSGGEQQMLAIGRGVMADPRVLLIDELSLGLMPLAIDECYRVLHRLAADGIAILLVEQNTERVLKAAGHIAVLETGKITWTGTGSMAMANSAIVDAYLGADYR